MSNLEGFSYGLEKKGIQTQFLFILIGVVGVGVAVYFGMSKQQSSERPVNSAGESVVSGATGSDASGNPTASSSSETSTSCSTDETAALTSQEVLDTWKMGLTLDIPTATPAQMAGKAAKIQSMLTCLRALKTVVESAATSGATAGQIQEDLTKAIEQTKEDIQVAKDRAVLANFPEYTRSYYDGWFPMNRPFRKQTMPILIGASLFFLCMSFLSILSVLRLDVRILRPIFTSPTGATPLRAQAKQPLFLLVSSLLVVVSGLAIWGFTRGSNI